MESFGKRKGHRSTWKTILGTGGVLVLLMALLVSCAQPAAPTPTAAPAAKPAAPAPTAAAPAAAPTASQPAAAPTSAPKPAATVAPPTPAPAALTPVKLASTGVAITYVLNALTRAGLDKKYGLALDISVIAPADGQAALLTGKVDVATIPPLTMVQAKLDGHDVVMFGPGMFVHGSVVVPPDSPAKTLEDLKGKRFGTLAKTTAIYRTMQMVAKEKGMDFEKDLQLVIGGSMPVLVPWLQQKQVEGLVLTEPFTSKSIVAGYGKELFLVNDLWKEKHGGLPAVATTLATTGTWFNKNRDAAKRLTQAYIEAGAIASTAAETRAQAQFLELQDPKDLEESVKRFPTFFGVKWDQKQIDDLYAMAKAAAEFGAVTAPPKDGTFVLP